MITSQATLANGKHSNSLLENTGGQESQNLSIKDYIKGCTTCQTTKIYPLVKVPLKPNEVPNGVWETITMDFIIGLPISQGYDSILTVVDRHSNVIILSRKATITVEQTSQLLMDNIWKHMGFPLTIISDCRP